jgi:hypothetical protein
MRKAVWLLIVALVAAQEAHAVTAESPQRIVSCSEIVRETPFPYRGAYKKRDRYRLVLGSVSVPPLNLIRSYRTLQTPWRYFSKRGMVVRRGTAVTITVPSAWRRHVAISWGNAGHGVFHTIRIAACSGAGAKPGYAYAGGFYLRRPTACVPLTFIVGGRRRTMWFEIGKRCG